MKHPEKNEYDPYYERYISLVEGEDIIAALENQSTEIEKLLGSISEEKSARAYVGGKWTIKEMLGHLIDGELIFAYRALRISRLDKTPIEGFEQDPYAENSNFNNTTFSDLTEQFLNLRKSNTIFFKNLKNEAWLYTGTASENTISVRALAYIIVGHVAHHANILKEKYLNQ